jgi:hypothetical protein
LDAKRAYFGLIFAKIASIQTVLRVETSVLLPYTEEVAGSSPIPPTVKVPRKGDF